jgi:glucoselysine-6-phosphate deglycase
MKNIEDYVYLEPKLYADVIKNREPLFSNRFSSDNVSGIDSIVLYATGSSANAAFAAAPFMSHVLHMPVQVEEPSFAANYGLFTNRHTLYIAISQGGHSYSTIHVVEELQKKGHLVYVLTSDPTSPISNIGQNILDMGMPIEEMPYVSAGYSVTILDLMLISLELQSTKETTFDIDKYVNRINHVIEEMPAAIKRASNWVNQQIPRLNEASRVIFIGYGAGYGVAREGETKITETVRITAQGKELEEYMHGPYLGLHQDDDIFFIEPQGRLQKRAVLLKNFLSEHVKSIQAIYSSFSPEASVNDLMLELDTDELLTSLFLTTPIHLLAYRWSQLKGHDLTVSAYPDFDKITGSKI